MIYLFECLPVYRFLKYVLGVLGNSRTILRALIKSIPSVNRLCRFIRGYIHTRQYNLYGGKSEQRCLVIMYTTHLSGCVASAKADRVRQSSSSSYSYNRIRHCHRIYTHCTRTYVCSRAYKYIILCSHVENNDNRAACLPVDGRRRSDAMSREKSALLQQPHIKSGRERR